MIGLASAAAGQSGTHRLTVFTSAGGFLGTAQVTSSPAGIDCRSESSGNLPNAGTCSAEFLAGSTVTLTATPLYDGTFDGWVGACAGQVATCQLVVTGALTTSPKTIAKTFTLTIVGTGNASGFIRSVDDWARPRLACAIDAGVAKGTCTTEYPLNQMVWLGREESASSFARFVGYTGCGPNPLECRFFMAGPRTVTAGWSAMEIIIGGGPMNGSGRVTGTATNHPIGAFDCTITPTGATGTCSAKWETRIPPMSITLTATPDEHSVFRGWSGKCTTTPTGQCVISIEISPLQVWAWFERPTYLLSISAAGSGDGTVNFAPPRYECVIARGVAGSDCTTIFPNGSGVTLTADPRNGSTFGGWSGACSGAEPTCVVTIDQARQLTARFDAPRGASELALALLGGSTLSPAEHRELDRFGNADGTFNLGDLLALMSRTGENLSPAAMSALLQAQPARVRRNDRRNP